MTRPSITAPTLNVTSSVAEPPGRTEMAAGALACMPFHDTHAKYVPVGTESTRKRPSLSAEALTVVKRASYEACWYCQGLNSAVAVGRSARLVWSTWNWTTAPSAPDPSGPLTVPTIAWAVRQ